MTSVCYGRKKLKARYSVCIPLVSRLFVGSFLPRPWMKYARIGFHPVGFFYFTTAVLASLGVVTLGVKFLVVVPV